MNRWQYGKGGRVLGDESGRLQVPLPRRWIMTDPDRFAHPDMVMRLGQGSHALASPPLGLIIRPYTVEDRRAVAAGFLAAGRALGMTVLIAGDWPLAHALGADGVHLPEWQIRRPTFWRKDRPDWIVTAATHNRAALTAAARAGVDAVFVSPAFPTASHPGAPALGPLRLAGLARHFPGPVFALGGMDDAHMRRLKGAGIAGWAGISPWIRARTS